MKLKMGAIMWGKNRVDEMWACINNEVVLNDKNFNVMVSSIACEVGWNIVLAVFLNCCRHWLFLLCARTPKFFFVDIFLYQLYVRCQSRFCGHGSRHGWQCLNQSYIVLCSSCIPFFDFKTSPRFSNVTPWIIHTVDFVDDVSLFFGRRSVFRWWKFLLKCP